MAIEIFKLVGSIMVDNDKAKKVFLILEKLLKKQVANLIN